MPQYDDVLGDEIKAFENEESGRAAPLGIPVVVRLDGRSFSKFTKNMERPFDTPMADTMAHATKAVVDEFHCKLGYTQSDEMSFLLWNPEGELPFAGRYQKIASSFAAFATAAFLLKGMELMPESIARHTPSFDGRAHSYPTLDLAAKAILWREIDARKNAVSMAARAHFPAKQLHAKSSMEMRAMMKDVGVDFYEYPERFRRGAYMKRITSERMLEEHELARIPEKHRPTGPVKRSIVAQIDMPPLSKIENLADVLFHGAEPQLVERQFSNAVII